MILTKKDLKFYLEEDRRQYKFIVPWRIGVYFGVEQCHAFRFLRSFRLLEYSYNNSKGFFPKLRYYIRKLRHSYLSYKEHVVLHINTIGYGLRIAHMGNIIINCEKMGNYCTISTGVIVGNKHHKHNRATIGNNVELTIGSKIIGKVRIGNNVIVAPNSVVTKDIENNYIVSGIPAKFIKYNQCEQSL